MDTEWRYKFSEFDHPNYYFVDFMTLHSVCLNSTINPILYVWRMKSLRLYATKLVLKVVNKISPRPVEGSSQVHPTLLTLDKVPLTSHRNS